MTAKRVTATVLDTTGVQPYIFGSNRLRENIGASYLAAQATHAWVNEALKDLKVPIRPLPCDGPVETPVAERIETGDVQAEAIYAGGGNTVLLFATPELAQAFTGKLTARVLHEAPGLNLVAAHQEFVWDETPRLHKVVSALMRDEIDRIKRERMPSAPLLGLGVTAACGSTGLPAVATSDQFYKDIDDEPYPISREVAAKLKVFGDANEKLARALGADTALLPYDLDNLGRSEGTSSYVAVVHADGNSIGTRFIDAGERPYSSNRAYIDDILRLSHGVHMTSITALGALYKELRAQIEEEGKAAYFAIEQGGRRVRQFQLGQRRDREGKVRGWYLPFRPLVYGGDDLTFVCDGRIGLGLAARYLALFERRWLDEGSSFTACAGIAVVKSHYPFARSYALSERLCGGAKRWMRGEKEEEEESFSALDWHIASSGPTSDLAELRAREYRVPSGELQLRPVRLRDQGGEWRTWPAVRGVVRAFVEEEAWRGKRNKVIALREALRQGGSKTEQFLSAYELLPSGLPAFAVAGLGTGADTLRQKGWFGGVCGYFDAIEAMEFLLDPWTVVPERATAGGK